MPHAATTLLPTLGVVICEVMDKIAAAEAAIGKVQTVLALPGKGAVLILNEGSIPSR